MTIRTGNTHGFAPFLPSSRVPSLGRKRIPGLVLWALIAGVSANAHAYVFYHCDASSGIQTTTPALVADLNPGPADADNTLFGIGARNDAMIAWNGTLYFRADDGTNGAELWTLNPSGLPALLADIAPGPDSSAPHAFEVHNGALHFAATGPRGEELYRTDGTTVALAAETVPGLQGAELRALTSYAGGLYFIRRTDADGEEIWRYDGIQATGVDAINQSFGIFPAFYSSPTVLEELVVFDGRLFFVGQMSGVMYELWAYDGTNASMIKAMSPGQTATLSLDLGVHGSHLYFPVVENTGAPYADQDTLWRYDGTQPPTKVTTFPGTISSWSSPDAFVGLNGTLHFTRKGQLFRLGPGGATDLSDTVQGLPGYASNLSTVSASNGDALFFSGQLTDWRSPEPMIWDGTSARLLANLKPDSDPYPGSFPSIAKSIGNRTYFFADDGQHGRELFSFESSFVPGFDCLIVAVPVWDDWTRWPRAPRTVLAETHFIDRNGRLSRTTTQRFEAQRGRVSEFRAVHRSQADEPDAAGPSAMVTILRDAETGQVVDTGSTIIGAPGARHRALIERRVQQLLREANADSPEDELRRGG